MLSSYVLTFNYTHNDIAEDGKVLKCNCGLAQKKGKDSTYCKNINRSIQQVQHEIHHIPDNIDRVVVFPAPLVPRKPKHSPS